MNLTISGHHLDVTPALREYVMSKLGLVMRHFDQAIGITVLLVYQNHTKKEERQQIKVTLRAKGKKIFVAESSEDLYVAIDQLMAKLDCKVGRYKERRQGYSHTTFKRQVMAA